MWWHVVDQEFQRETKQMGTDKNGFILILPSKGIVFKAVIQGCARHH